MAASRTTLIYPMINLTIKSPIPSFLLPYPHRRSFFRPPRTTTIVNFSQANNPGTGKQDIVIIGAGIAGLATAVSLQRLGIRTKVIEQAESLRVGGTSLTLFKNGWSVLDAIGVGHQLRNQFLEIEGMLIKTDEGKELRSFRFKDEDESQEVRAVERRILLETLANELPPETISFSSKLANIEEQKNDEILLEFDNGNNLSAEILIACDGIRSPVAKWMGFPEPKYVGHCAFRGLGFFPDGQPFEPRVNYIYGTGIRAGFVPVSPTKVYWFVCFNSSSPGPKITDPSVLRQQTKELVGKWSLDLTNIIDVTPDDTLIRTPLADRWLWPAVSPPASKGKAVVVGDAWHPMTPNLGQGACCALEDAVVLSRYLAQALKSGMRTMTVEDAFRRYEKERWSRVFPLTIRANFVGTLLQWDDPLVCTLRNRFVIPKLVRLGPVLEHTNLEFEPLQPTNT